MTPLAALALCALTVCPSSVPREATERDRATITYVAREELEDAELAKELAQIGGPDARRLVLALGEAEAFPEGTRVLAPRDARAANAPALERAQVAADVLVLRGGDFLAWYETVHPEEGRTRLAEGLKLFLASKRPIIAHGGAAAFLSGGVSVPKAELKGEERNPRRREQVWSERVAVRSGPRALFDADGWEGGSPLRLLQALHRTHVDAGLHFSGEVALRWERERGRLEVLGPGSLLAFDLRRARRPRRGVEGARLARLSRGDVWDLGYRRQLAGPGKQERKRGGFRGPRPPLGDDPARTSATDLRHGLAVMVAGDPEVWELERADAAWRLSWDGASRRFGSGATATVLGVELRCQWAFR